MQDGAAVLAFAFARRAAAVRGVRRFAARIARFLTSAGNTYMQIYLVPILKYSVVKSQN